MRFCCYIAFDYAHNIKKPPQIFNNIISMKLEFGSITKMKSAASNIYWNMVNTKKIMKLKKEDDSY